MKNFTLITALCLCSFSWISASVSQSVEVQSGEEVTLLCSNMSTYDSLTFWDRLVNRTKISCISVRVRSTSTVKYCEGFQNGNFEMRSNISTVSLKINKVDLSDSGLYFCGVYENGLYTFSEIPVHVEEEFDGIENLTSVILGGLTVLLVMVIIGLVVEVKKLQKAANEEHNPQQRENLDSDHLKDAALSLYPAAIRNRRPASQREVDTHVIYAASK